MHRVMRRQVLSVFLRRIHAGTATLPNPSSPGRRTSRGIGYGLAVSFGLGAAVGGYMAIDKWRRTQVNILNPTQENGFILKEKPSYVPSRSVNQLYLRIIISIHDLTIQRLFFV